MGDHWPKQPHPTPESYSSWEIIDQNSHTPHPTATPHALQPHPAPDNCFKSTTHGALGSDTPFILTCGKRGGRSSSSSSTSVFGPAINGRPGLLGERCRQAMMVVATMTMVLHVHLSLSSSSSSLAFRAPISCLARSSIMDSVPVTRHVPVLF